MPAVAHPLVGREDELGSIERLLRAHDELPAAAVLHGDAGVGKTTVWLAATEAAAASGYRVLSCRAAEAETRLAYAGLADLLDGAVQDVLAGLPPVQRRALEGALLLGEPAAGADERAVAASFLGALRGLAKESPLCVAIDDLQWLDAASLAALRFALPRLTGDAVAVVPTARGSPPSWVRRTVPEPRLLSIELTGLGVGALHELLRTRLRATFPRPTLIRIWETSAGNPFFALELAAALERRGGSAEPGEPLPIPSSLDELLRERLDGLHPSAVEVARVVAAAGDPTASLVDAVLEGRSEAGLSDALDARILELERGRIRFTHPLLGSAVASHEPPTHRRALHARLADVLGTAEERARHLALATIEPSREIAAVLEDAARSAHLRGAPWEAAELAEHALRLTPAGDANDARRRRLDAAARHRSAGDTERATALLERGLADAPPGAARAMILVSLAELRMSDPPAAEALLLDALAEADGEPPLVAKIHLRFTNLMRWRDGVERGARHADLAVRASRGTEDVGLRASALAMQASWEFRAGRGLPRARLDEALALERTLPTWPLEQGPASVLAVELIWALDLDEARTLLHAMLGVRTARGDYLKQASALWFLGLLEWRAGNWAEAERLAGASLELSTQLGNDTTSDFPMAVMDAHRGRIDAARAIAQSAIARSEASGIEIEQAGHWWILGFVELSLGDAPSAVPSLKRSYELKDAFMLDPGMRLELGDLLEALVATGELDEAAEILAVWEPRATAVDRAWALAILARCRGLLRAAGGDLEGALSCFEASLAEHERTTDPFQQARTLQALGRTQRRAKQRAAARSTLDDALARFEQLGAPLWAEQTRAELARIGGRAPSRGELTEAERRIAILVAEGRSNRDVAAALFLTEHSVETALTRVYRKLGVHSRGELAHRLGAKS